MGAKRERRDVRPSPESNAKKGAKASIKMTTMTQRVKGREGNQVATDGETRRSAGFTQQSRFWPVAPVPASDHFAESRAGRKVSFGGGTPW